jgi:hypothetical protein
MIHLPACGGIDDKFQVHSLCDFVHVQLGVTGTRFLTCPALPPG